MQFVSTRRGLESRRVVLGFLVHNFTFEHITPPSLLVLAEQCPFTIHNIYLVFSSPEFKWKVLNSSFTFCNIYSIPMEKNWFLFREVDIYVKRISGVDRYIYISLEELFYIRRRIYGSMCSSSRTGWYYHSIRYLMVRCNCILIYW